MKRREFLRGSLSLGAVALLPEVGLAADELPGELPPPLETALPEAVELSLPTSVSPPRNIHRTFVPDDMGNDTLCSFHLDRDEPPSEGEEPIWIAAVNGEWETVKKCLEQVPALITFTGAVSIVGHIYRNVSLLHLAASWPGNEEMLEYLLSKGADVNAYDDRAGTPLHIVTKWCPDVEALKILVDHGADVNTKNKWEEIPLHHAAKQTDVEILAYLISQGADVHAKNKQGETPLHCAVEESSTEIVAFLVSQGADISAKTSSGDTLLHLATRNHTENGLEMVKYFVAQGCDVNARNNYGDTPLHKVVSRNPNVEILQYLLSQGADIHAKNDNGQTPLHKAASLSHPTNSKYFIDRGIGFHEMEFDECTVLTHASFHPDFEDNVDVLRYLISIGADPNVKDADGKTPLHVAAMNTEFTDNVVVLCCLVEAGADPNVKDTDGKTPLLLSAGRAHICDVEELDYLFSMSKVEYPVSPSDDAETKGRYSSTLSRTAGGSACVGLLKLLIALGADVNVKNSYDGRRLLDIAAYSNSHVEVLQYLVSLGFDVNEKDDEGRTPLMSAAVGGTVDAVKYLVSMGADVKVKDDNFGMTPLHLAAMYNPDVEVLKCLISLGADASIRNNNGRTPLDLAREFGYREIVEILSGQ